jgi:hypothetical protein
MTTLDVVHLRIVVEGDLSIIKSASSLGDATAPEKGKF